ncbi:MAG TPA: hypothetical protein VF172_13150 [Nitrososphaera sp.]
MPKRPILGGRSDISRFHDLVATNAPDPYVHVVTDKETSEFLRP